MWFTEVLGHFVILAFSHASTGITVTKPWRWLPAPFHQLPLLWRMPFLSMAERYMVQRGMFRLMRHVKIADEDISAATWAEGSWSIQSGYRKLLGRFLFPLWESQPEKFRSMR